MAALPATAADVRVNSAYDESKDRFTTDASVELTVAHSIVGKIGNDFTHYRDWALAGINGGVGNPRKFISLIKDVSFDGAPKPFGRFTVVYDVDLPLNLDRKDEKLNFKVTNHKVTNEAVDTFSLTLDDSSLVIRDFNLTFKLEKTAAGNSLISFHSEFALRALFNPFFSLERYRSNVEWRIVRMVENLQDWANKHK